jgi:hypothetical protein
MNRFGKCALDTSAPHEKLDRDTVRLYYLMFSSLCMKNASDCHNLPVGILTKEWNLLSP